MARLNPRLKEQNQIAEQTEEAVELLTEPLRVQYLVMQPETMQAIAADLRKIGESTVKSMGLISDLPTQDTLDDMMQQTVESNLRQTRAIVSEGENRHRISTENKIEAQTTDLKRMISAELRDMTKELKARDLSPWKIRLKWLFIGTAIGAILPSALLLWQLMFK